jgi:hypothetical protein
MPVTPQWDNDDKTIIRYDLTGRWTWDEFFAAFDEGTTMLDTVQHTIHFIVNPLDLMSRGYLPPGALQNTLALYRRSKANAGSTVIVGGSTFFRSLYGIGQRIYPRIAAHSRFADSLDQARILLSPEPYRKENILS